VPTPDGARRDRSRRPARGPARLPRALGALEPEQRIAAGAALALWISMFLPWYGKSVTETVKNSLRAAGYDLSAFGAFSFVEAAVLLVATAVLALLFARAERRAFHLPGGDGLVILAGGVWVSVLIFYRMLDKPGTTGNDRLTTTVGLQWGIFFALAASLSLAYAGARVRAAHRPEPALRDDPTVSRSVAARSPSRRPSTPPRPSPPGRGPTRRDRTPRPPADDERTAVRLPPRPVSPASRPTAPPFDADADPGGSADAATQTPPPAFDEPHFAVYDDRDRDDETVDRRGEAAGPPEDPPTRAIRRVPRFDDLDADWIPTDQLSLEADPPPEEDNDDD
jgi:hypothetical protein